MNLYLWKESKWESANKEVIGLCDKDKRRICTKEGEDVSIVEGRKRRDAWVYWRTTEESVYRTLKATSNGTSILCREVRNIWYRTIDI